MDLWDCQLSYSHLCAVLWVSWRLEVDQQLKIQPKQVSSLFQPKPVSSLIQPKKIKRFWVIISRQAAVKTDWGAWKQALRMPPNLHLFLLSFYLSHFRLYRRSSGRSVTFDQQSTGGGSMRSLRMRPESPAWFNTLKNKMTLKNKSWPWTLNVRGLSFPFLYLFNLILIDVTCPNGSLQGWGCS